MQAMQLFVTCKFSKLSHLELCFLEAAIDVTDLAECMPAWAVLHQATARLIVLILQVC